MPDMPEPVRVYTLLAQTYEQTKQFKKAAYWYEALSLKYPAEAASQNALKRHDELVKEHALVPPLHDDGTYLDTGIDLRKRKFFDAAIEQLTKVLNSKTATAEQKWEAAYQRARTFFQQEKYKRALESLNALPPPARKSRIKYVNTWRSRSLSALNRPLEAERVYLSSFKSGRLTAKEHSRVFWLLMHHGLYEKAKKRLGKWSKAKRKKGHMDFFWDAWLTYRDGQYALAERKFSRLTSRRRAEQARAAYWSARSASNQGALDRAKAKYQALLVAYPRTYYAYQASARLEALKTNSKRPDNKLFAVAPLTAKLGYQPACLNKPSAVGCVELRVIGAKQNEVVSEYLSDPIEQLSSLTRQYGKAFPHCTKRMNGRFAGNMSLLNVTCGS